MAKDPSAPYERYQSHVWRYKDALRRGDLAAAAQARSELRKG